MQVLKKRCAMRAHAITIIAAPPTGRAAQTRMECPGRGAPGLHHPQGDAGTTISIYRSIDEPPTCRSLHRRLSLALS